MRGEINNERPPHTTLLTLESDQQTLHIVKQLTLKHSSAGGISDPVLRWIIFPISCLEVRGGAGGCLCCEGMITGELPTAPGHSRQLIKHEISLALTTTDGSCGLVVTHLNRLGSVTH